MPAEEIIANASMAASKAELAWYESTPWLEIKLGVQAIVPLVIFLLLVLRGLLGESEKCIDNLLWHCPLCGWYGDF